LTGRELPRSPAATPLSEGKMGLCGLLVTTAVIYLKTRGVSKFSSLSVQAAKNPVEDLAKLERCVWFGKRKINRFLDVTNCFLFNLLFLLSQPYSM
jgi:hypothetical protein